MAKKKEETVEENTDAVTEETVEKNSDDKADKKSTPATNASDSKKNDKGAEKDDASIAETLVNAVADTVSDVAEAVVETASDVAEAVTETAGDVVETVIGDDQAATEEKSRKRNEKVGIVYSDKMTNTVVVRVNRMVKHQLYHKYMKKRRKFMAHDEMGASVGDRVRIVETRPLSAKKRWRVVEILQKAEK